MAILIFQLVYLFEVNVLVLFPACFQLSDSAVIAVPKVIYDWQWASSWRISGSRSITFSILFWLLYFQPSDLFFQIYILLIDCFCPIYRFQCSFLVFTAIIAGSFIFLLKLSYSRLLASLRFLAVLRFLVEILLQFILQ